MPLKRRRVGGPQLLAHEQGECAEQREWVVHTLLDPLVDVGVVAAEGRRVAANERQELGDHVMAATAGAGEDARTPGARWAPVGPGPKAEYGDLGGIKDEVARVGVVPAEGLVA